MSYKFIQCGDVKWTQITGLNLAIYAHLINNLEQSLESTGNKYLPVWINSGGGEFYMFLALRDYFNSLKDRGIPIVTIIANKWGAKSAGLSLYAMGDLRYATDSAGWLLHTVSCVIDKPQTEKEKEQDGRTEITLIDLPEPDEGEIEIDVKEKTDTLFSELSKSLGIEKQQVYDFLEKHGDGTNEIDFGLELAKELNLFTHMGIPIHDKIIEDLKTIDMNN